MPSKGEVDDRARSFRRRRAKSVPGNCCCEASRPLAGRLVRRRQQGCACRSILTLGNVHNESREPALDLDLAREAAARLSFRFDLLEELEFVVAGGRELIRPL